MDTEKLKALMCSIETGSLSAAAEKLGYTPSGISRSIAALEEMFGFSLLLRGKNGVSATAECEGLLSDIRNMLHMEEQLMQRAAMTRGVEQGSVTAGTAYPFYNEFLAERIVSFRQKHPGIEIRLVEGTSSQLVGMLNQHLLDICIVSKREIIPVFEPIVKDSIIAWVPPGHPAVSKGRITLKDLEKENYIQIYPGRETDNSIFLQKKKLKVNVCAETSDIYAAYSMVESGLGIALVNAMLASKWQGKAVALPLDCDSSVEIGLAHHRPEETSPAAAAFLEYIREGLEKADE
ncbi:MAG: LysR family transcriptional regulator [Lachnospiraceae bacterium]|nr:LysR family transcriptional regulator [Lachnospiraceae bacterium]